MRKSFKIVEKLNTQQKLILAVLIPFILFLITYPITLDITEWRDLWYLIDTWYLWAICFLIIGVIEILLIDKNYSKIQKIIFAIAIPLELFLFFYVMAKEGCNPFDLEMRWGVWVAYIGFVGIIEFILFSKKHNAIDK